MLWKKNKEEIKPKWIFVDGKQVTHICDKSKFHLCDGGVHIPLDQGATLEQRDPKTGLITIEHLGSIPIKYNLGNVHN